MPPDKSAAGSRWLDPWHWRHDGVSNSSVLANLVTNVGVIQANGAVVTISRDPFAWTNAPPLNAGVFQMNGGTFTVADDGEQNVTRAFQNNGTILGSGTLAASVLQSGGGVTLASNGVLNIYGNFAGGQAVYDSVGGQYGTLRAMTGGVLKVTGPITGEGGFWGVDAGGLLEIATNVSANLANAYIPGSTMQGTVLVDPGAALTLPGSSAGGPFCALYGTLNINNSLVLMPNASGVGDLTNEASGVISGSGTLQTGSGTNQNNYAVVNFGAITVPNGATLTLDPEDAFNLGGVQNALGGTMNVGAGGTLVIRRTDHAWTDVPYAAYPTNLGTVWLEGATLLGQDTSGTNFMASLYVNGSTGLIHGCGTIQNFATVLNNGTIQADCGVGANLNVTGILTNTGSVFAINGTVINLYGPVVNTGQINATNGAVEYFSTFQNTGSLLGDVFGTATNGWISPISGKWEIATNWSAGTPNIVQPALYITNAATKIVTIDATTTNTPSAMIISNLYIAGTANSTNTLFLNNAGTNTPLQVLSTLIVKATAALVVNNSSVQALNNGLEVGYDGSGTTLVISNGGAVVDDSATLDSEGSQATAIVTGTGSVWSVRQTLFIGYHGSGTTLVISNGGVVVDLEGSLDFNGQDATAIVTGPGSGWSNQTLYVGEFGSNDTLVVSNGAAVVDSDGHIGYLGSNATAIVAGPGSVWSNQTLRVGDQGYNDTLVISSGGSVVDSTGYLDNFGQDAMAIVTGPGSVWSSQTLYVGEDGYRETLIISNGGAVVDDTATLDSFGQSATGIVTGPGSVWSNQALYVGYYGGGDTLVISNGGSLVAINGGAGQLVVGEAGGSALLSVSSNATVTADQFVAANGANSIVIFNGGTIASGGTFVTNNQTFFVGNGASAATFQMTGTACIISPITS